ncbi:hypothetical protein [Niastella koreensis]|uniref:hypothetical protein n=1 Tax=Niastella koreensis TaxID=354356 RepID=UPI001054969D|nr:hypothetical protein [Niastella koreensis]
MKDGDPTIQRPQQNTFYEPDISARKLCLVWESGRELQLYYRDLVDVDFDPDKDSTSLILQFLNKKVILKGQDLYQLIILFRADEPCLIVVSNKRYIVLSQQQQFVVTDVIIE